MKGSMHDQFLILESGLSMQSFINPIQVYMLEIGRTWPSDLHPVAA